MSRPLSDHSDPAQPIDIETLLLAYRNGIFPMSDARDDDEVFWVEPRERAIIPLDGFRCSRSLAKTLRQDRFKVTCNTEFSAVIEHCAAPRDEDGSSWISHRIQSSYEALHHAGHAHSIECRQDGQLVGGLYGIGFDQVFCGESMFSRATDASKVALAWLVAAMRRAGFRVLDCQFMTGHLRSLGAVCVSQEEYLTLLYGAKSAPRHALPDAFAEIYAASSDGSASSPGKLIAQSLTQTS